MFAYLEETDLLTIEKRINEGDIKASEVLEAMCYQTAKEIAGLASVLYGKVDAIYMTGGMANSKRVTSAISERISFIAPIVIYPGEYEMQSLCLNVYDAPRRGGN